MKNIILGTAGHIDHGKTTLIKNLTGIDTDTLPEEAKRGMTINIGFAYYETQRGKRIGIIDVPGHEKFIKNMAAGATGIDFIILVIACDDGIMPQTREHFNILRLLGVKRGVIALTKRDLVDEARAQEVKRSIEEEFRGSFLESARIIELSSKDPMSYGTLKEYLEDEIRNLEEEREEDKKFRLSVDRVFTVKGFGTVITGTSLSGEVSIGDTLIHYPTRKKVRIKGIENHGIKVERIGSGNRTALNLGGIEREEIKRGDILSEDANLLESRRIDIYLTHSGTDLKIKNNHRIRLHLGTTEVIGRIKLLGRDELTERESSFAQLDLETPVVALPGDLGIIRNYSPMETIGGVKILNMLGEKIKRNDEAYLKKLSLLLEGGTSQKIQEILRGKGFIGKEEIEAEFGREIRPKDIEGSKIFLLKSGARDLFIGEEDFESLEKNLLSYLVSYHGRNPLKNGVSRSEVKAQGFSNLSPKEFGEFLELLEEKGAVVLKEDLVAREGFKVKLTKEQKRIKDEILTCYKNFGFSPEKITEVEKCFKDRKSFSEIHSYLVYEGFLIYLGEDTFMMRGFFKEAQTRLKAYLEAHRRIALGDFRDLLETSRRYALLLLEALDRRGVTVRDGEYRILK